MPRHHLTWTPGARQATAGTASLQLPECYVRRGYSGTASAGRQRFSAWGQGFKTRRIIGLWNTMIVERDGTVPSCPGEVRAKSTHWCILKQQVRDSAWHYMPTNPIGWTKAFPRRWPQKNRPQHKSPRLQGCISYPGVSVPGAAHPAMWSECVTHCLQAHGPMLPLHRSCLPWKYQVRVVSDWPAQLLRRPR